MKLIVGQFEYAEFNDGVHFFCYLPEIHVWGKFGSTNQNCQSKVKLGTQINLNMQNSMVVFTFLFYTGNTLFTVPATVREQKI